jgi:hypothetical protein
MSFASGSKTASQNESPRPNFAELTSSEKAPFSKCCAPIEHGRVLLLALKPPWYSRRAERFFFFLCLFFERGASISVLLSLPSMRDSAPVRPMRLWWLSLIFLLFPAGLLAVSLWRTGTSPVTENSGHVHQEPDFAQRVTPATPSSTTTTNQTTTAIKTAIEPASATATWHGTGKCAALSVSNVLCASSGKPSPRVAVLFFGGARTFENEVVWRSFNDNFLRSFGGEKPVLFAAIRLTDARSDVRKSFGGLIAPSKRESFFAAAERTHLVVHQKNVEFLDAGLMRQNCTQWAPLDSKKQHVGGQAYASSLIGQVYARYRAMTLLVEFENATGVRFDVVFATRPDMTYLFPMDPWCATPLSHAVYSHDWQFRVPRAMADRSFIAPWRDISLCKSQAPAPTQSIEGWQFEAFTRHRVVFQALKRPWLKPQRQLTGVITRAPDPAFPRPCEGACYNASTGNICNVRVH